MSPPNRRPSGSSRRKVFPGDHLLSRGVEVFLDDIVIDALFERLQILRVDLLVDRLDLQHRRPWSWSCPHTPAPGGSLGDSV